jgi:hypothetical protein
MEEEYQVSKASISEFFVRSGLTPEHRIECYEFIAQLHPGKAISAASCQGYCSMTIFVGYDVVIQFRPYSYRLDLRITSAAKEIYGRFAPETQYITTIPRSGLLVYQMERIRGISFKDLRARKALVGQPIYCTARLCIDFADFLSKSWKQSHSEEIPLGIVGRTIQNRVRTLCRDLPPRFQPTARKVLRNLRRIEALPWVLTHGDIVTGNILVDPSTEELTGFVDWAEAERLPFGICLYGLEELLGEMTPTGFQYHPNAHRLREMFWAQLKNRIPELGKSQIFEAVKLARDLGVLLWHGIAFDDGAINRVVQEGRDKNEIHRLDAFLDVHQDLLFDKGSRM